MSYSIKDLKELVQSDEFKEFQWLHQREINIGEKIYARRKDLVMTQKELSLATWIPQNKISQMETATYGEIGIELIVKLSEVLKMPLEYLLYDSINRKTLEMYNYVISKIKKPFDIMQFMKIPYFIDLQYKEQSWKLLTNFQYMRWNFWPFDKKVYDYQKLFSLNNEKGIANIVYIHLTDEDKQVIDQVLEKIPYTNGDRLKKLSYDTPPMQSIWATLWGSEHMWELLKL